MKNVFKYLSLFTAFVLFSFVKSTKEAVNTSYLLLSESSSFEAGKPVVLKFASEDGTAPLLFCSSSYGTTLVTPTVNNDTVSYTFPKIVSTKKGLINWHLINTEIDGKIFIHAKQEVASLETYIGPPTIEAGEIDFSRLVVIPTDNLDNPLDEQTNVETKQQFLNEESQISLQTKNLIAHRKVFSKKESGRILVSSSCLGFHSKEFTVDVLPAIPKDFTISATRPHEYADGNQITTIVTSVLKDSQKNTVSDGTYVDFLCSTPEGNILKTSGLTLNGVATSKIIHPEFETTWNIKAYVYGMAESNEIQLQYKQAIRDFEVVFSEKNRKITIGPLQSFMQQMIPDGLSIHLRIYKNDELIHSEIKTSFEGFASFYLKPAVLANSQYKMIIKTAGIEKKFENITLW